jgi:putative membrane protein
VGGEEADLVALVELGAVVLVEVEEGSEEVVLPGAGRTMDVQKFFTPEEKERIHQAAEAAEIRTSGEIVPMVVGKSASYLEVEVGGLVVGLVLGTAFAFLWADPWGSAQIGLLWPLLGSAIGFLVCRLPGIKRRLVSGRRVDEAVHSRSLAAFAAHGLHYTREHTGILILASLLEHRVEVLADRGINRKVQSGTWDEVVKLLTSGLKSGDACAAFCAAIERCGDILAQHFPRRADDRDELADTLVTEG